MLLAWWMTGCGGSGGKDAPTLSGSDGSSGASWSDADTDADSDTDADTDADTAGPPDSGALDDSGDGTCGPTDPTRLFLSPDDSNSMASPVLVRAAMAAWGTPEGTVVRPWEFLNYYAFDYPAAEPGELALDVQLAPEPALGPGGYRLQLGLASEHRPASARAPANLALSIDTSGSMTGAGIARARDVCRAIAGALREGDVVSVVTWDDRQRRPLEGHGVSGADDPALLAVCDDLAPGGSTDLHAGLVAAYDLVRAHARAGSVNRVVLISDGGANVGVTDAALIGDAAQDEDGDGVYLVGVGVGDLAGYSDSLMDEVTDLGRGAAVYVPDAAEAQRMFGDRFGEVMDVAARGVQVRLDLPPTFTIVETTAEEVSTDPTEIEPQHLAPDDTMVFHQQLRSCDPSTVSDDTPITVAVTWQDDEDLAPRAIERTFTFGELLARPARQLVRGAAIAACATAFDERTEAAVGEADQRLRAAEAEYPGDAELAELRAEIDAL